MNFFAKLPHLLLLAYLSAGPCKASEARRLLESSLETELIELQVPGGAATVARKIRSSDLGGGSFSWSGSLLTEKGFLSFAKVGRVYNGSVTLSAGRGYCFKGDSNGLAMEAFSPAKGCGGCIHEKGLPPDPRKADQPVRSWRNGDANLVDLLVVYPAAVRSEAGDANAVAAIIASAVEDANLCYRNSLVPMQLRVVHVAEVVYTPTGQMSIDLSRLRTKGDGFMDDVHTLRDQYGADLVTLLTPDSDSGGLASTMTHPSLGFESSGFSVNIWDQIGSPSYTLAHEIGHNMGCLHNREDATWDSDFEFSAFSFGKRWQQGGQGYRSIMSYDSNPSVFSNRIPYFSSPDVTYLGTSVGNAGTEDNAQVLSLSAPYVSNFRKSVVQALLPTRFDLQVVEGGSASLKVRLAVQPTVPVQVSVSISGDGDLSLAGPTDLNFDTGNWNIGRTIHVFAQPDADSANGSATLTLSANGIPSTSIQLSEIESGTTLESSFLFAGVVSNELGMGLSGVTLTLTDAQGSTAVQTDANGSFRSLLAAGWSGAITPSRAGYVFAPSSLSLGSILANSVGHEFSATRSSIFYVDKDAVGSGDGTSWANAATDLAQALVSQASFNEVWVAEGTYFPGSIRPSAFILPPNIQVYGGFGGTETLRDQRNPSSNHTILSGDLGVQGVDSDNAFHVVIPSSGSVLDGFVIKDGHASKNFSDDRGKGAGLWADSSTFTIRNCTFSNNRSRQGGSGAYLKDANATFISCIFSSNAADSSGTGGGVLVEDSNVSFQFCSFTSNSSGFAGGAMRWNDSVGSLLDCNLTLNQNTSANGAGALYLQNTPLTVTRSIFTQNSTSANSYGGAIKLSASSPSFTNCIFTRNFNAGNSGGAIYVDSSSNPTFSGNEFRYNSSVQFGGAIFTEGQTLNLDGGLFLGNHALYGGGVSTNGSVAVSFSNLRIIGNEANASGSPSGGFAYFNTGLISSTFVNCSLSGNKSSNRNGVYRPKGLTRFVNCSFAGNEASALGGIAILFSGDSIALDNCIIWGNSAGTGNDVYVNAGSASANSSLYDPSQSLGSITGSNNLNSDPLFVDANGPDNLFGTEDDDLSLQSSSPVIDQASPSVANYSATDALGRGRSGNPDMGAYEFIPASPPSFTSSASFSAQENQTQAAILSAVDPNGDSLIYSIAGGSDQALFSLDSNTGALSFNSSPDFESPTDQNTDNVYELIVRVSDGSTQVPQNITVTVLDVNESVPNSPPVGLAQVGALSMLENEPAGTVVGSFVATDPDGNGSLSYYLHGGHAYFTMDLNGTLRTSQVLDYESNASHLILVRAYDLYQSYAEGNFTVTVLDVNESVPN
ncbi:MAG TPA: hypothetical protein DCG39_01240, partial [Opitutae bacterium]|nr:hypothetical protein [Opitutae bacterium]